MVEIISHRGNINGINRETENTAEAIDTALSMGFSVEIDIWSIDGVLYLGHDGPERLLHDQSLLTNPRIYVHAKNIDAISALNAIPGCQWFWHENDSITITSTGKIWCFPKISLKGAIYLDLADGIVSELDPGWLGVCTDTPSKFIY